MEFCVMLVLLIFIFLSHGSCFLKAIFTLYYLQPSLYEVLGSRIELQISFETSFKVDWSEYVQIQRQCQVSHCINFLCYLCIFWAKPSLIYCNSLIHGSLQNSYSSLKQIGNKM